MRANNSFDHRLSTTLVICIVYPLGPAAIILMPMIVGGLIDSYGFTEQQAANIASLEGLGLVFASVFAAIWIRKFSWVRALSFAFLLYAVLNVVSANLDEYTPLLVTRFLTGLAGGNLFAVTVAALGDNREPDRAFGLAQAVQGAMMLAAFAAAPYLIQAWNVGALYYMLAAASILVMLTLFRFPAQGLNRTASAGNEDGGNNTPLIWLGLIASIIFFVNVFGFWAFVERIGQAAELPASTIGLALGISQIMTIVGALGAALASDRYGRYLPLLIVLIGQSMALFALIGKFGSVTFFLSAGAFQALFVVAVSYQMGAIAKLDIKGRYLVMMTAAQGLGAAIGPAVAAAMIREGNDYSGIMLMAALLCLISTLLFLFVVYRSRNVGIKVAAQ
jgi:predicted MFS family arabinose efflux permease